MSRASNDGSRPSSEAFEDDPAVGLCVRCRHAAVRGSSRGSRFWQCLRAEQDSRFARYPRLPVTRCSGFTYRAADPDDEA